MEVKKKKKKTRLETYDLPTPKGPAEAAEAPSSRRGRDDNPGTRAAVTLGQPRPLPVPGGTDSAPTTKGAGDPAAMGKLRHRAQTVLEAAPATLGAPEGQGYDDLCPWRVCWAEQRARRAVGRGGLF